MKADLPTIRIVHHTVSAKIFAKHANEYYHNIRYALTKKMKGFDKADFVFVHFHVRDKGGVHTVAGTAYKDFDPVFVKCLMHLQLEQVARFDNPFVIVPKGGLAVLRDDDNLSHLEMIAGKRVIIVEEV